MTFCLNHTIPLAIGPIAVVKGSREQA